MKPGIPNRTWYSFKKYNKRSDEIIIAGMMRRFKESKLAADAQVIQFYNNHNGQLIEEYKE